MSHSRTETADAGPTDLPQRPPFVRMEEQRRRAWWRLEGIRNLMVDMIMLAAAAVAAALASPGAGVPAEDVPTLAAFIAVSIALLALSGIYRPRTEPSFLDQIRTVIASTAVAATTVTFVTLLLNNDVEAARQGVREWMFAAVYMTAGRGGVRLAELVMRRRGAGGRLTLVVGAGRVGRLLASRLLAKPEIGLRPVGFVDDHPIDAEGIPGAPVLGPVSDLEEIVAKHGVEHAILSFSAAHHEEMLAVSRRLQERGVAVSVVPRLFEGIPDRTVLERIAGLPVVSVFPTDPRGWRLRLKYAIDRPVAALAALLLSPLLIVGALAVLVGSGRPVLFRQRRVGMDGREFEMFKFRTMTGSPAKQGEADADWAGQVLAGAEQPGLPAAAAEPAARTTRVGRILRSYNLDELPQLFNVLRGEMSFIGPRPEREDYARRFASAVYRYQDRYRVKSGITGWAQVHGLRGKTSLTDRIEWDNYYVENWSLWLDLKIALLTVVALFRD